MDCALFFYFTFLPNHFYSDGQVCKAFSFPALLLTMCWNWNREKKIKLDFYCHMCSCLNLKCGLLSRLNGSRCNKFTVQSTRCAVYRAFPAQTLYSWSCAYIWISKNNTTRPLRGRTVLVTWWNDVLVFNRKTTSSAQHLGYERHSDPLKT